MQRDNNFDLIRFIAASFVLFSHSYALVGQAASEPVFALTRIDTGGGFAVAVFFAISGYLITGSCLKSTGIIDYIIKRVLRLFPGLIACIILTILLLGLVFTTERISAYLIHPLTMSYWDNAWLFIHYSLPGVFERNAYPNVVNGSLWTLPVEALMYILVLLLRVFRMLNTRAMVIFIGVCWLFYFRGMTTFGLQSSVILNNFPIAETAKLACFFFGGSLIYLHKLKKLKKLDLAILLAFIIVFLQGTDAQRAVYVLFTPLLVILLAYIPSRLTSSFGKHGDISYGIYIYAFPLQQTVVFLLGNSLSPVLLFWVSWPLTCIFAALSWKIVEKPALSLKKNRIILSFEDKLRRLSAIPLLSLSERVNFIKIRIK